MDKLTFLLPYVVSCAISVAIGLYAWRRQATGARAYALVALSQGIWTLGFMLELVSDSLQAKVLWESLQWLNDILYPWAVLLFALQFAQVEPERVRRIRSGLLIFPTIFWILVATNSLHGWVIPDATLIPGEPFSALTYTYTPTIYLAAVYIYALIVAALYVLAAHFFRSHRIYRAQIAVITLAHLVILAGGLLTLAGVTLANQRDHTPLTFAISNLMIAWGLFRFRLLDLVPVARETVVENMSDSVIVVDEQNRVVDLNAAARAFVDPSQKNVIGTPLSQVFSQWSEMVGRYAAVHEASEEIEASVNGEQRYYALKISPLYDQGRQLRGRILVSHDITEHKRVETALRLSEERYRIVSELISDYAFLYAVEPDGTWKLEWITGDSFTRVTGYDAGELGTTLRHYHPDDKARALEDVDRTLQGKPTEGEYRIVTKGGEERWVYIRRYPLWDSEEKRVVRFYGVAQDVTERKRIEQQLAKERTLLQTVINNLPDTIFVKDRQGRNILVNLADAQFVGAESTEAMIGKTAYDYFSPELAAHFDDEEEALMESGQGIFNREVARADASGKPHWFLLTKVPLRDNQDQVIGLVGISRDITERKQAEEALRLSEERYRIVSELISDYAFLYAVEPDGTWKLEWITGDSYTRVTGYAVGEIGATFRLYHPEDQARAREDVQRTLQGKPTEAEYRIVTKSGEERWVYIRRYPLWDSVEQRVLRFYGVAQDVTERKRIEQQLAEEQALLQTVMANLPDSVFVKDRQGRNILSNLADARLMDQDSPEAMIGQTVYDYFSPELAARFSAEEEALMDSGQGVYNQEVSDADPSGKSRWVLMTKVPLRDHQDQVIGLVGIARDVTERKRMEEALRVSEERYRIVTEVISDYAFLYAVEQDGSLRLEWITGDSATRNTGYAPGEIAQFRLYHPEDEARAREDVQRTLEGQSTEGEYRIVTKSGEERWVYIRRYPLWDTEQKRVVRFYGVAQDITERKRAEAEEREQRALAEALLDTADALNSTLNLEDVLDRILTNVERVAPHDAGTVMLIESGAVRVVRAKSRKRPDWKGAIEGLTFPLTATSNLQQVYQTRQPLILSDVKNYPGWVDVPASHWIRSHIAIPIQQEEEVIGFLTWESAALNIFTPKVVSRLQAFAHQTAIAITNARLYRQAQELAVLEERQRLARDLHDAVTQTMFSAGMIAETLPRLWEQKPHDPQVPQALAQLQRLTRGAVAEMRSLLLELRPEALEGVGLPKLITQLAEAFSGQTGIVPALDIEGERTLPPEVKITLYRIAQEALNNVSKHARASELNLKLTMNHMVELIVMDNGRGFLPEQVKSGSLGLKIMRERAEKIGARFTIESEPGKNTTVAVEWTG